MKIKSECLVLGYTEKDVCCVKVRIMTKEDAELFGALPNSAAFSPID